MNAFLKTFFFHILNNIFIFCSSRYYNSPR